MSNLDFLPLVSEDHITHITEKMYKDLLLRAEINIARYRSRHPSLYQPEPPVEQGSVAPAGVATGRGQYPLKSNLSVASVVVEQVNSESRNIAMANTRLHMEYVHLATYSDRFHTISNTTFTEVYEDLPNGSGDHHTIDKFQGKFYSFAQEKAHVPYYL